MTVRLEIGKAQRWNKQTTSQYQEWEDIVYSNGLWVLVGGKHTSGNNYYKYIYTSSDLTNWTERFYSTGTLFHSVAYNNNKYIVAGNPIAYSSDGTNWTTQSIGGTGRDVIYANNLWVMVGEINSSKGGIFTSTNGTDWNTIATGSLLCKGIAYGNNKFVVVGDYGIATSSDGVNWTSSTKLREYTDIAFGNNKFVCVDSNKINVSTDGENWTTYTVGSNLVWNSITYGNGTWVAVSDTGLIATSIDTEHWSIQKEYENNFIGKGVAFENGIFVACGNGGNYGIILSELPVQQPYMLTTKSGGTVKNYILTTKQSGTVKTYI